MGYKAFLVDSGVPEFGHLDDVGLRAALAETARLGTPARPARRGRRRARGRAAASARGRGYAGYLASRPRAAEKRAVERVVCCAARRRRPGAHRAPVRRRRRADRRRRPGRRDRADRRDLPALPDPVRRRDPRRRNGVQVLPAHPRARQPGRPVGRAGRRHDRHGRVRPLAQHRRPQAARHRGLRVGVGRRRRAAARACPWSGPRRVVAATRWPTWCVGWARGRPTSSGSPTGAGSPSGPSRTWSRSPPTRSSPSTSAALHHKNPVSPYAGRTLTGVVRRTWLHGIPVDLDAAPRGRLLRRGSP